MAVVIGIGTMVIRRDRSAGIQALYVIAHPLPANLTLTRKHLPVHSEAPSGARMGPGHVSRVASEEFADVRR